MALVSSLGPQRKRRDLLERALPLSAPPWVRTNTVGPGPARSAAGREKARRKAMTVCLLLLKDLSFGSSFSLPLDLALFVRRL